MKKISLIGLLVTILLATVACSNQEQSNEATPASEASFTLDNYDREVTITGIPEKVLTFGPNTTELMIGLGLQDKVIGNTLNNHSRGALPEYKEAYDKIPELNYGSATREAVLTSGADFIYGIDWEFGEEAIDLEELNQYEITAYLNSATTLEEIYQEISDIGKIFAVEDQADDFIIDQQTRIEAMEEKLAVTEPVNVLIYDSGGEGVFTAGGDNFETVLIEAAGGKNIFDDITDKQWSTVSYEEVISRDPDVILIHDYDVPSLEEKIAEIKSNPALSELESVKQERFVTISLESVLPGARMAYAVEELAAGFHPELFE
ncbi:ABC transporter substrate-binding protein [Gracilibacillus alcaliphilus]|uniref:ABC transporter substrate-binding protein n=1 Tax=Gracilibacillus alcaliphilus TaxID=1401441 RepID=UPI001955F885|nr:ABC transporter substrate-binding protein [Gracilibacillus alcaliphilus]MBM7677147.1 iron complex transport system substrate-binding protein [Gracilibacillus alcaliphilus]